MFEMLQHLNWDAIGGLVAIAVMIRRLGTRMGTLEDNVGKTVALLRRHNRRLRRLERRPRGAAAACRAIRGAAGGDRRVARMPRGHWSTF